MILPPLEHHHPHEHHRHHHEYGEEVFLLTLGQVGEGRAAGGRRAAGRRAGASSTQGHAEQRGELEGQRHWHHPSQHAVGQRERCRGAHQTTAARHGDLSARVFGENRRIKMKNLSLQR